MWAKGGIMYQEDALSRGPRRSLRQAVRGFTKEPIRLPVWLWNCLVILLCIHLGLTVLSAVFYVVVVVLFLAFGSTWEGFDLNTW